MQPTVKSPDPHHIYIDAVQGHQRRWMKVIRFTSSSTKAAAIMLLAAIVALIVANSPAYEPFIEFWHTEVVVGIGSFIGEMSFAHIINDIFMAVFFLLVGLEIKYEMTVGELTNIRQAALPIIAAFGGVLAPIVIYSIFNAGNPETAHGWGVPTATDIAFALGIMSLLGNRVPNGVRVFLSTLAVADDIIAIIVIAVFYGQSPSFMWLAVAAAIVVVLALLNRAHVYSLAPYLLIGCVLWFAVFMSGVHSTIAGVLLAFTIPTGSRVNLSRFMQWSDDRVREASDAYDASEPVVLQKDYMSTVTRLSKVAKQVVPPATRLEHMLYPWVYFAVLPLFALTNADVNFIGNDLVAMVTSPVFYGVFFGLLLGKPIGILLFSFITVKTKIASLPENVNWMHMVGAAILGGVGFTMAIFVANLAFPDDYLISDAKIAILSASLLAGIIGFSFLFVQAKAAQRHGISYMSVSLDDVVQQTANIEAAEEADDLVIGIGDDDLLDDVRDVLSHEGGHAEFVLHEVEGSEDVEAARAEAAAIGARVVEAEFSEERKRAFKEENEDVTGTR
jgi:NhaA family Na+:H+ antiporter